ncbi:MAG: RpiB/LacA/LacB family sugar-phosphate isomerase [Blastochloris sp.]|nr:RpiB/LacA/LacB family sugar-phosphate isomerase [Blastochloris sp.]
MKLGIAADHGGYELKAQLMGELQAQGYELVDFGPDHLDPSDDYPDFGIPAAQAAGSGEIERAILICNNGIGMGILANKIPGVRAAVVYNEQSARHTREHHDSNVLALGGQEFSPDQLKRFINIWLHTDFAGGRHERRMDKVRRLEE